MRRTEPPVTFTSLRRAHRIAHDVAALEALAHSDRCFSCRGHGRAFLFRYADTPGLVGTAHELAVWIDWSVTVRLGPGYPVQPPVATLLPERCVLAPWHPNVLPAAPYPVCYGRHVPIALLDELARRLKRLITLDPHSVMVDERDAMNPPACPLVRRLIRESWVPLTPGRPLPDWCRIARGLEVHG